MLTSRSRKKKKGTAKEGEESRERLGGKKKRKRKTADRRGRSTDGRVSRTRGPFREKMAERPDKSQCSAVAEWKSTSVTVRSIVSVPVSACNRDKKSRRRRESRQQRKEKEKRKKRERRWRKGKAGATATAEIARGTCVGRLPVQGSHTQGTRKKDREQS